MTRSRSQGESTTSRRVSQVYCRPKWPGGSWLSSFWHHLFFVAVVVGSIIRRAWAPLLALLIPLAFIPAGRDSDGTYTWLWALILFVPPVLVAWASEFFCVEDSRRLGRTRRTRPARSRDHVELVTSTTRWRAVAAYWRRASSRGRVPQPL